MLNIEKILTDLALRRPLFHSEADFQHELAWEIRTQYPSAKIRLEKPFEIGGSRKRVDLEIKINGQTILIELKYKKTNVKHSFNDEDFKLSADSAHDIGRYDFIKDIVRLESAINPNENIIGYAIILTNEDLYWNDSVKGKMSREFFVNDGIELTKGIEMKWHDHTSDGTKKNREKPLVLNNNYKIKWQHYSDLTNQKKNNFKYLLLKVENQ